MDAIEHLLQEDLNHLVDRIACRIGPGAAAVAPAHPDLHRHLETASRRLADVRMDLVERYAQWQLAIEHCERLWTLADLSSTAPAMERQAA